MKPVERNYKNIATKYAKEVCSGKKTAGKFERLHCQRFVKDLEKKNWEYKFDEDKAGRACRFIERLTHVKGSQYAGKKIVLEPWQVFVIVNVFGWLNRKTGLRRFRQAQVWVARKNGKSTLAAPVALYMELADGEAGAEVYAAATKRDQARLVFDPARAMLNADQAFAAKLGAEVSQHAITKDLSTFKPLASEADTLDGLNIHCSIVDEIHAHKNRDLYDVLVTAMGARAQPLMFIISTAGTNMAGIGYEQFKFGCDVLEGKVDHDETFVAIWQADPEDAFDSPVAWEKANPNIDISVSRKLLAADAKKASRVSSSRANFETKHCNRWVNAAQGFININDWDACAKPELVIENFKGKKVWIGFDLAQNDDLSSVAYLFPEDDGGYSVLVDNYLPESAAEGGKNDSYSGWVEEGYIKTTEGNVTDYSVIMDDILRTIRTNNLDLQAIGFDPWHAGKLVQDLQKELGETALIEVKQNTTSLTGPTSNLQRSILNHKLRHNGNACLRWQVGNAEVRPDDEGNLKLRKPKHNDSAKKDALDAIVNAFALAMEATPDEFFILSSYSPPKN